MNKMWHTEFYKRRMIGQCKFCQNVDFEWMAHDFIQIPPDLLIKGNFPRWTLMHWSSSNGILGTALY